MRILKTSTIFALFLIVSNIKAQETATITKTQQVQLQIPVDISKTLGLYMFPAKNQDASTQKEDNKECYIWAYQQTGFDPSNPTKIPVKKAQVQGGTAVVGSAKGAAAGAAIGAIAGDAGKGAAIGAVTGALGGIRARRIAEAEQQERNKQLAVEDSNKYKEQFNKAFSSCIQAKGYTVN